MKVLGHSFTAVRVFPAGNKEKLVWGAILPEMMFYVNKNPFSYEEIHEGGDAVVKWARVTAPAWIDLGLGIMTHSVRWGVDYFNELDQLKLLGYDKDADVRFNWQVAEALGVDLQTAKVRVHNILDLGLEVYIALNYPKTRELIQEAFDSLPVEQIAHILATVFGKNKEVTTVSLEELKRKIAPQTLTDRKGVAEMWCRFSEALPEQHIDLERVMRVLEIAEKKIRGKEDNFLNLAIEKVEKNLQNPFF